MEIGAAKPPFADGAAKTFVMSSPDFSIALLGATLASRHGFGRSATPVRVLAMISKFRRKLVAGEGLEPPTPGL